jgi:hypothetical protein
MGSVGDAYDNALAESFFATLECELLDGTRFRTQIEARMAIFDFIEGWYNPHRRRSGIGYDSPSKFEKRLQSSIGAVGQKSDFHTGSQSHDLDPKRHPPSRRKPKTSTVHRTGGTPGSQCLVVVYDQDRWR